jgi:RNA polymerase sigma factor (sigma-70 family)
MTTKKRGPTEGDELAWYLKNACSKRPLDAQELKRLAQQVQAGGPDATQAAKTIVEHNTRLVVSVAKRLWKRYRVTDRSEQLEMIQDGNRELLRVAGKYNPGRGITFSSYATPNLRWAIFNRLTRRGKLLTIPADLRKSVGKVRKARLALEARLSGEPDSEQLAAEAGLTLAEVEKVLEFEGTSVISLSGGAYGPDDAKGTTLDQTIPDPGSLSGARHEDWAPYRALLAELRDRDITTAQVRLLDQINQSLMDAGDPEEVEKALGSALHRRALRYAVCQPPSSKKRKATRRKPGAASAPERSVLTDLVFERRRLCLTLGEPSE